MAQEIEIKLRIHDEKAFRRLLTRLGIRPITGKAAGVHEKNIIFDTPQGGLAKHGQLLRIRTEAPRGQESVKANRARPRVLVTFKKPISKKQIEAENESSARRSNSPRHKIREEIEVEIAEADPLIKIFEGLGMTGWFSYEKYRTTFKFPATKTWAKGLLIELDKTPIGTFVELEGPPEAIDRAAQALGFSKQDYILKNYLSLYVEECRKKGFEPSDMLFPPRKATAK